MNQLSDPLLESRLRHLHQTSRQQEALIEALYLAQALKLLEASDGGHGIVIATEYEAAKEGPIDFVLMDIWEMARPAIELIAPHLRRGAIVIADNTGDFDESYVPYFDFVRNPDNAFTTQTLPFAGGLEMTVKL